MQNSLTSSHVYMFTLITNTYTMKHCLPPASKHTIRSQHLKNIGWKWVIQQTLPSWHQIPWCRFAEFPSTYQTATYSIIPFTCCTSFQSDVHVSCGSMR